MPRFAKQLLYGTFYFAIFCGILLYIYQAFFKPLPSCFDRVQNQGEAGIDCGPVCGNFCLPATLQPIEAVGQVNVFHPLPDRLAVLAQIQNPNSDVGVATLVYHIAFFDANNIALRTVDGTTYIYPQQTKYIAEFPQGADLAPATHATIAFDEPQWGKGIPPLSVSVQHSAARIEGKELVVEGTVSNNDTITATSLTVLTLFYGKLGQLEGVSKAELSGVGPGDTRAFSIQYPSFSDVDLSNVSVVVNARG